MKFKYIDVHAHVNFPEYDEDRGDVIKRALDEGVYIINVGTDIESSKAAISLAEKYEEGVYAIVGIHPHEVMDLHNKGEIDNEISKLNSLAKNKKVIAIGECGLDFFKIDEYNKDIDVSLVKEVQERVFRAQIDVALENNLPIMIHARDSYGEILEILNNYLMSPDIKLRGNVHFFAGSIEQAKAFIGCGFTVSFTGVITFAKNYEEIIRELPLNSILSETDCPFVAPVPFRGKRAEPIHVKYVVEKIAEIKGISIEEARIQIKNNVESMFFAQTR